MVKEAFEEACVGAGFEKSGDYYQLEVCDDLCLGPVKVVVQYTTSVDPFYGRAWVHVSAGKEESREVSFWQDMVLRLSGFLVAVKYCLTYDSVMECCYEFLSLDA